jgi:hypothetical protein
MDKLLLRITEAGALVGAGRSKSYELAANGEWEVVNTPYGRRVVAESLEKWVQKRRLEKDWTSDPGRR